MDVSCADGGPAENEVASSPVGNETRNHLAPFRGYGTVVSVLLGLLIAGAVAITVSDEARRQVGLSFIPKPERYTELYFSGERPVQSVAAGPGGESVEVRFTIANHEGRAEVLRYTVRLVDDAETSVGSVGGSVQLQDTGVTAVFSTIPLSAATPWSAVEITLDGRPERLRFLRAQADAMAG